MDAGDTLCERMREVLHDPTPDPAVVTCFQRVMLLGFVGSFRSLHDPERLKLVNALSEHVPPFRCPQSAPVLIESRAGLGISGWLASAGTCRAERGGDRGPVVGIEPLARSSAADPAAGEVK